MTSLGTYAILVVEVRMMGLIPWMVLMAMAISAKVALEVEFRRSVRK